MLLAGKGLKMLNVVQQDLYYHNYSLPKPICLLGNFIHAFLSSDDFFFKINFSQKFFQEYHENVKQNVRPYLDLNCLHKLSPDDTTRQRVNHFLRRYLLMHK